jgi:hypothetical protein
MILKQLLKVSRNVLGRAFSDGLFNVAVCANDVTELVSQIVFVSHASTSAIHGDTGTDWWRRYRKDSQNHPLGAGIVRVKSHVAQVSLRNPTENAMGHLRCDVHSLLPLGAVFLNNLECCFELQCSLPYLRLHVATSTVALDGRGLHTRIELFILVLLLSILVLALAFLLTNSPDTLESNFGVASIDRSNKFGITLEDFRLASNEPLSFVE